LDVSGKDAGDNNPLLSALRQPYCDAYIIEELLKAGVIAASVSGSEESNAATLASIGCRHRPYGVENLSLIAHLMTDINAVDSYGRNALHYAALGGSAEAINILLGVTGIDIDMQSKDDMPNTALDYAATFDHPEAVSALIKGGATIDLPDCKGRTPLMSAVLMRKPAVANMLLDAGASPFLNHETSPHTGTILHVASAGASTDESILRMLLEKRPELQTPVVLNTLSTFKWTALYKATYFGDHDAVEALLAYGADCRIKNMCIIGFRRYHTAFDEAVRLLEEIKREGLLSPHHERIKVKGPQAVEIFVAGMSHIKEMLQDAMEMQTE
jgi:ankyrin repeat protein